MEILYWTLLIAGGFLLGSIMFCQLIPKVFLHKDIAAISVDNNPGAFNVFKHCGVKVGIPCLLADELKGFIPVLLASILLDADNIAFAFVIVAPALGHAVGLFNRFRGGKCIAVSFGIVFGLIPVTWIPAVALAALYIVFSALIKIKPASLRSVIVYILFAVICGVALGILKRPYVAVGCGLLAMLPAVKFLFSKNGMAENNFRDAAVEENESISYN